MGYPTQKKKPDPIETAWYVRLAWPFFVLWAVISSWLWPEDDS